MSDDNKKGSFFTVESDDLEVAATVTGSAAGGAVLVGSVVASGILGTISGLALPIAGPIIGGIAGAASGYILAKRRSPKHPAIEIDADEDLERENGLSEAKKKVLLEQTLEADMIGEIARDAEDTTSFIQLVDQAELSKRERAILVSILEIAKEREIDPVGMYQIQSRLLGKLLRAKEFLAKAETQEPRVQKPKSSE